ncbi:MAG: DUF1104 domain-containing protein [Campylobacteraceae bacterium]
MKKIATLFLVFMFTSPVFAKTDFSSMSTQELIAMMGYVKQDEKRKFEDELRKRVPQMNPNQKNQYQKNIQERSKR